MYSTYGESFEHTFGESAFIFLNNVKPTRLIHSEYRRTRTKQIDNLIIWLSERCKLSIPVGYLSIIIR